MRQLQVADVRIVGAEAPGLGFLGHQLRGDGPVVVQIDLQRRTAAVGRDVVVVVLRESLVVDVDTELRIGARREHVVDVAAGVLRPADEPHGGVIRQRQVHKALQQAAGLAVLDRVDLALVARLERLGIRLVGDDPDRAGFRARPVQSPLRTGQHFHPLDVIDVHVERTLDSRDRLLVQVGAHRGQRPGVVEGAVAGDAPDDHVPEAGPRGTATGATALRRHAGEEFQVVVETVDVQLIELRAVDRRDAQGNALQILRAFLRRDDDLLQPGALLLGLGLLLSLGVSSRQRREDCRRQGRHPEHAPHIAGPCTLQLAQSASSHRCSPTDSSCRRDPACAVCYGGGVAG